MINIDIYYLIYTHDKGCEGALVELTLKSLCWGSLKITLTVPLKGVFTIVHGEYVDEFDN